MLDVLRVEFRPIDVERHLSLCIAFSEDMFRCSFGSAERFYGADGRGAERYAEALCRNATSDPGGFVHVWVGEEIVGQVEVGRYWQNSSAGFVFLVYVVPQFRGTGLAIQLDDYIAGYFRQAGICEAYLLVSPTNERARRFYTRQGWRDLGDCDWDPANRLMHRRYCNTT